MITPDERVLKALCNLEDNRDFLIIREWVLASEQEQLEILRVAEGPNYLRAQGADKELLQFVDYAANARDTAAKVAMQKAGIHAFPS